MVTLENFGVTAEQLAREYPKTTHSINTSIDGKQARLYIHPQTISVYRLREDNKFLSRVLWSLAGKHYKGFGLKKLEIRQGEIPT